MAQYQYAIIPLSRVIADYFPHLDEKTFLRKQTDGQIRIPVVRIEASQKAARGVALVDLAAYLEQQRGAAIREMEQLNRGT